MTDEQVIDLVRKILKQAKSFGLVGNQRPAIYVRCTNPFRIRIGELSLGEQRALALADGKLTIEARAFGWVLVGQLPIEKPRRVKRRSMLPPAEKRRAEYLREVGRDTITRKEA